MRRYIFFALFFFTQINFVLPQVKRIENDKNDYVIVKKLNLNL